MAARDGAGRTALHRALATGDRDMIDIMLTWSHYPFVEPTNVNVREPCEHSIWNVATDLGFGPGESNEFVKIVSSTNGFNALVRFRMPSSIRSSPLHNAIIHKQGKHLLKRQLFPASKTAAEEAGVTPKPNKSSFLASKMWEILHKRAGVLWQATTYGLRHRERDEANQKRSTVSLQQESMMWQYWALDALFPWRWYRGKKWGKEVLVDAVELAAFVGDVKAVKRLPLGAYNKNSKSKASRTQRKQPWPALHIAANAGNYEMVKVFLDDPLCDPYVEDWEGNTALHHVLNVVTLRKFEPHLLDYVNLRTYTIQRSAR